MQFESTLKPSIKKKKNIEALIDRISVEHNFEKLPLEIISEKFN